MEAHFGFFASSAVQPAGRLAREIDDRAAYVAETAKALATLTTAQRQVLVLSYFEHLTQAQIAARLNVPRATVRVTAATALRQLARALESRLPT